MIARSRYPLIAAAAVLLGGCNTGVLAPEGPVARSQRLILFNSLAIMLAIVIPTIAAALLFAWHYRQSNPHAHRRLDWAYSGRLELIIWSIPTLVILFLSGVIWVGSHLLDPARPLASAQQPLEVQVVSLDWKWLFIYPEQGIASVNRLVVPAGRPIHFSLTSASVMNAFFVPQLGGMIATMNRMVTQLHLQADRPGEYYGRSAQFSGDGFSDMQFVVHAITYDGFDHWIDATRRRGPQLDASSYARLARQGVISEPFTYSRADPKLFDAVVNHQLAPAPGPGSDAGGSQVRAGGAH